MSNETMNEKITDSTTTEKDEDEKDAGEKDAGENNAGEKDAGEKNADEKDAGEKNAGEKNEGKKNADEKDASEKDDKYLAQVNGKIVVPYPIKATKHKLEDVVKGYVEYGLFNRLLFLIDACPDWGIEAVKMLLDFVTENTANMNMYDAAYHKLSKLQKLGVKTHNIPPYDKKWFEETEDQACIELKVYKRNFYTYKFENKDKEITRLELMELIYQYMRMGYINEAMNYYTMLDEYCIDPYVTVEMMLVYIRSIVRGNLWSKFTSIMTKMEGYINYVIMMEKSAKVLRSQLGFRFQPLYSQRSTDGIYQEIVKYYTNEFIAMSALYMLSSRSYREAAELFILIHYDVCDFEGFLQEVMSRKDIALYGTLCAIATFSINELKERALGSLQFQKFLDDEPEILELIQLLCNYEFSAFISHLKELLEMIRLNIYISPHIRLLLKLIHRRTIIQYLFRHPDAKIPCMALVFGVSVDKITHELSAIINSGLLKASILPDQIVRLQHNIKEYEHYMRSNPENKEFTTRMYCAAYTVGLINYSVLDRVPKITEPISSWVIDPATSKNNEHLWGEEPTTSRTI